MFYSSPSSLWSVANVKKQMDGQFVLCNDGHCPFRIYITHNQPVSLIAVMLGKSQVVSRLNRQSWRDLPFSVYIVIYTTLYWQYIWQYIKVIFFKYVFEWKRISYYWEVFWWIPFGSASVSQGSCAMTQVFCSYISSSLAISSSCSLIWTFTSQSGRLLLHPAFLQRAP